MVYYLHEIEKQKELEASLSDRGEHVPVCTQV